MLSALAALVAQADAQTYVVHVHRRALASNVVIPQTRAFSTERRQAVEITEVSVGVVILEQVATTTMDISLKNPSGSRLEAELIVPVPDGAVVRGFTFQGAGSEPSAALLPKDEARSTYDAIVARVRDPALLEFLGYNLIRSSVFPVEPHGTQKVRLTYEHLLTADGERVDYVLPRTESLDYTVPWKIAVKIKSKRPVSTVYSPSHRLETTRSGPGVVSARMAPDAGREPGAFRLSYLLESKEGVSASLFAYPDPKVGGGYFLLLAGLPAQLPEAEDGPAIKREVTLVLDRSGSMRGEKLQQVREAALQILGGLEPGEMFNLIAYSGAVDVFAPRPVVKSPETVARATQYLNGINSSGGTNIHDALLEALRQKPADGMLPIVLFLTDGLPTMGQTSEVAIRNVAIKANPHKRRVFTFGVGLDVNTPLLDKIASETRATATFVLPKEDVEVKVAGVFKRLAGPVLADPALAASDAKSSELRHRVKDILPARLPDLFEDDQLVVLGRYVDEEPIRFRLHGNYLGRQRDFDFSFDVGMVATTRNSFVPRLWASRKIGTLIEAIRALGADADPLRTSGSAAADPRTKELVDEIVRLSTEFGILTEYTAFLAREGTDLGDRDAVRLEAQGYFDLRNALRSGKASMNQDWNSAFQREQFVSNPRFNNEFLNENLERVAVTAVQQVNDRAFYRRGNRWVDSRIVQQEKETTPAKVVDFGSGEFRKLALRLAEQGRQGTIALKGEILMVVDGEAVLVRNGAMAAAATR
jgi:Ca-activated chloride channel family protein